MRLPIYKIVISAVLALFLLTSVYSVFAASVAWQPYSDRIFTTAKNQKKLILVYVKSDTCPWCMRMNSEVFTSKEIVDLIHKKFIPVIVDITNEKSIADQYGAFGTPTFIILDSDKHQLSNLIGFQSEQDFKSYLEGF